MASRQTQQPSQAPFIILGGIVLAGLGFYTGWPGVPVLWLALIVTAWLEPPVMLTGKKDSTGYPTPAGPGEEKNLQRFAMWSELKWRLLLPNADWAPGWPVLGSFLGAVAAAAAAWSIPTIHVDLRYANAAAAYLIVAVLMGVRRRTLADDICPGARIDTLKQVVTTKAPLAAAAVIAGTVAGVATRANIPVWDPLSAGPAGPETTAQVDPTNHISQLVDYGTRTPTVAAAAVGIIVGLAVIAVPWTNLAVAHWRIVVAARKEWRPRWQALKFDPAPFLIDRQEVGGATVDTFMAPAGQGAMAFWRLDSKIGPTIGAGSRIAVLDTPNEGPDGPVPGTRHPLRFDVVNWPMSGVPDPSDPEVTADVAALVARCGFMWTVDAPGYGRPVLVGVEALHTEDAESAAWESKWVWPDGPNLSIIRDALGGALPENFGCEVLIDHRADSLFFGALTDNHPDVWASEPSPSYPEQFERLALEDTWSHRWSMVLKQGTHSPIIEHSTTQTRQLADGTEVFCQAFVTRMGVDPREFATNGQEKKLATSLQAAPFVTVVGWPGNGERAGERHPQALAIYWSQRPVPGSPETLAPTKDRTGTPATTWVLSGHINKAFDAARLMRPEVVRPKCLTAPRTRRGHIWEIPLRLHDGVTLSDVRGAVTRLRTTLGVSWIRVTPSEHGCVLYVGAVPARTELANPKADMQRLVALDWEQAWLDSGVSGVGGLLPELVDFGVLPNNDQVEVLDFKLPTGVDVATVKNAVSKLMASTNNSFVEVRPGRDASTTRLLVCEVNPLPERIGYDFEAIDRSNLIPFATGVEGEPIEFDHTASPHALLAGMTGAGKSVMAQAFLYGAIIRGFDVYVIDPVKGGADFMFAKDRCRAFAATPFEAAGLMKTVYEDVVQRKTLNAEHGVGSIDELPDSIRPPHVFVFIDEFTSLMGKSLVPKSDDPAMQAEIEMIEAENHARTEIGVYAGKLAREARSAGVHLGLGTQKLTAKMLDAVPGGGDLKDLSLDTLLPVPVSDRFPMGWARNGDLIEGDLLYSVDGSTTSIVGFEAPDQETNVVFEVVFGGDQRVKAGSGHWWWAVPRAEAEAGKGPRKVTTEEMFLRPNAGWLIPTAAPIEGEVVSGDPWRAGKRLAKGRRIRAAWFRSTVEQRRTILEACIGSVPDGVEVGTTVLVPAHRRLARSMGPVVEIARSLGLLAERTCRIGDGGEAWSFTKASDGHGWISVETVFRVPNEPTRCIAVDHPSHLFLVEGFIPTHNTNLARTLLGKGSFGDRASALRAPDDAPRLEGEVPKGRGLWEPLSSAAMVVQTWFEKQDRLRAELVARVPEIDPERVVDLSGFTGPDAEGLEPLPARPVPAADDEVIDVATVDLSLDDLDLSLDDLDGAELDDTDDAELDDAGEVDEHEVEHEHEAAETVDDSSGEPEDDLDWGDLADLPDTAADVDLDWDTPAAEAAEKVEPVVELSHPDTVVFVDVAGTLGPQSFPPPRTWPGWEPAGTGHASPAMVSAVADLGTHLVWLTADIEQVGPFNVLFGRPVDLPVRDSETYGWWKVDAALTWLDDHPEITRVIWFDSELDGSNREAAESAFDLLDLDVWLGAPSPMTGLTPGMVGEASGWLNGSVAPAVLPQSVPVPAAASVSAPAASPVVDDDFDGPAWAPPAAVVDDEFT